MTPILREPNDRRIYVCPEVAEAEGIDIERLRSYYWAHDIEIVTDPELSNINIDTRTYNQLQSRLRNQRAGGAPPKQTTKICSQCKTPRPLDTFRISARGRVLWVCDPCVADRVSGTDRVCPKCSRRLPRAAFDYSGRSLGGLTRTCSDCRAPRKGKRAASVKRRKTR